MDRDVQHKVCYHVRIELQQQCNHKDLLYAQGLQIHLVGKDNNEKMNRPARMSSSVPKKAFLSATSKSSFL